MNTVVNQSSFRYTIGSFGQVLLHLSSGSVPLSVASEARVWHGGASYNVIYSLKRVFGVDNAVFVTANVDNYLGRLLNNRMLESGAELQVVWKHPGYPGPRIPLYFTDNGAFGRPVEGVSDRDHSPLEYLSPEDIDWKTLFERGIRYWHFDGITVGQLSGRFQIVIDMLAAAKGTGSGCEAISYDLNPRRAVWDPRGGFEAARQLNERIISQVDILFCGVGSLFDVLGFERHSNASSLVSFDESKDLVLEVAKRYPNLRVIAMTWKDEKVAFGRMHFAALGVFNGRLFTVKPTPAEGPGRVGTGDAFASGVLAGLVEGLAPEETLALGHVHALHKMTTAGDLSRANRYTLQRMRSEARALER